MRMVNGYPCRNCADEELARRGVDPAHPQKAVSGNEVFVSPADAARNRGSLAVIDGSRPGAELGVNRPETAGKFGTKLNLYA